MREFWDTCNAALFASFVICGTLVGIMLLLMALAPMAYYIGAWHKYWFPGG